MAKLKRKKPRLEIGRGFCYLEAMKFRVTDNPLRDAAKADFALCLRFEALKMSHVESHVEKCSGCGSAIWVAASTPLGIRRVCPECAMKEVERRGEPEMLITARTFIAPGEEQLRAIADVLNAARRHPKS